MVLNGVDPYDYCSIGGTWTSVAAMANAMLGVREGSNGIDSHSMLYDNNYRWMADWVTSDGTQYCFSSQ